VIEVVSVAQLAEHRIVAPAVEGSNPFTHPNFFLSSVTGFRIFSAFGGASAFGAPPFGSL
jgi:hypothetical protein